jgi:hypothetical protein
MLKYRRFGLPLTFGGCRWNSHGWTPTLWRVEHLSVTTCFMTDSATSSALIPRSMWVDWRTTWMVVDAVAIEHRSVPSPVGLAETEGCCELTGQQVHEQTKGGNDATIWKIRR